jgi:hypothetical protein
LRSVQLGCNFENGVPVPIKSSNSELYSSGNPLTTEKQKSLEGSEKMNCTEFQKTAAEYFRQALSELDEYERLTLEKKEQLKERWREIFQISETPECDEADFDLEGDDDMLRLSFRGEHVDIQRSKITKSKLGWNLFSCLFKKHWDGFHVRDREGRIYIDLKHDGFKSLLNMMSSGQKTISNNRNVYHGLNCFGMLNFFNKAHNSLIGYSAFNHERPRVLAGLSKAYFSHPHNRIVKLQYINFSASSDNARTITNHDMQYKSLLLLAQVRHGPLIVITHSLNTLPLSLLEEKDPVGIYFSRNGYKQAVKLSSLDALESKVIGSNLMDILPLRLTGSKYYREGLRDAQFEIQRDGKGKYISRETPVGDSILYEITNCEFETLEICGIQREYLPETLKQVPSTCLDSSSERPRKSAKTDESNESSFPLVTKYHELIASQTEQLKIEMKLSEKELTVWKEEIEFMTNYFCKQWFSEFDETAAGSVAVLHRIIERKMDTSTPFPITTFNVGEKTISILRSTLLHFIPDSLLGIKVSGRWTIQPNEMDKKGNLIVNCSKEVMDQILTGLQFSYHEPAATERALFVTEKTKNEIETVLDYLQIQFFSGVCLES